MITAVWLFVLKYRHVILVGTAILSAIGTVYYIRYIQDQNAIMQKELEDNRIQQESLKRALDAKQKNHAVSRTLDYPAIVSGLDAHGWLRND